MRFLMLFSLEKSLFSELFWQKIQTQKLALKLLNLNALYSIIYTEKIGNFLLFADLCVVSHNLLTTNDSENGHEQ